MPLEQCSTIIVNYNSHIHVTECVRSVLTNAPQAEVIVVDNASTDDSLTILEVTFPDHPRLQIVRNPVNAGFAVACNLGTCQASKDYFFYLNPDCMISQETIPQLISSLKQNPQAGMAGGRLLNSDGSEQRGGRRKIPTPWSTFVKVFKLSALSRFFPRIFADFNLHEQGVPDKPIEVEAISGACMMIPRQAHEEVGGLDEDYFLHCEDLDWCLRFTLQGWKIVYVPDAVLTHFQGACSKSTPIIVEWYKHKGMVHFYRKFYRKQYSTILLWAVILMIWVRFAAIATLSKLMSICRTLTFTNEIPSEQPEPASSTTATISN
ncbi:glycosyltransferase family 2 protein [Gimesia algae]|uniref:N-acetylglucosaminyl-diphospho-decaprenol L-rhamnosyltransferase n=1 Tax=Gimesia algae TaxID=2527971 RepID=A0A517VJ46_9PLAN|nr:glycosyltransferase family 2 protein [Gimesia algae]QDT93028.1 N-acetylglucosaminyl-diphospho-decaprenol L-rhamnosyltransferase [Gimesia algae]